MVALLGKLKGNAASGNGSNPPVPPKKDPVPLPMTPLKRMLQDAGPLRNDGSDKFFGMENAQFGNTCYCNSILQCLYYSVPFRESVVNYPRRSPPHALSESLTHNLRYPDPDITLEEILKPKPLPITPGKPNPPPSQPQKPDDKDSSDSKKKIALNTLPLLETRDNSASYGMKESLFTSLKDIFEAIGASPERMGVIRPYHFLEVLRREHEMFRTTMHQDAHEFLNLLLNEVVSNVEADANRITDVDEQSDQGSEGVFDLTPTSSSGSTVPLNGVKSLPNTRWVHELFEGTLTSETQCLTCETVSQRDEVFLDLSVDLEQHTSVTACLRKFSEEEVLCERNKFYCDNCGGLQEAEKRMKIKRLPKILALHLKRFKYSEDSDRLQKLFHRVVYPYYLRLFNTTDDAEDPDRLYELYAVVVHIGGGPYHGHYVAIIKTEDRGWLLFDDEMVEPVDRDYVRTFFGDRAGLASAYVLFYQETTFEAMQRELAKENQTIPRNTIEFKETIPPVPKMNGHPVSPGNVHRVQSATEEVPTLEGVAASPVKPVPSAPPQLGAGIEEPNLLPHPKSPLSAFIPKIGDLHLRKERTKEEREKRAAEKEKEKSDKKQKALEAKRVQARKREEADPVKGIEMGKAEKESGLSKVGGLSRFKLGARSVSQSKLFHREKERTEAVPDVPSLPLMNNSQPESTTDVSARAHPSIVSTDDDKDDSTNSTSVCGLERPPLSTRTTALPPIPNQGIPDEHEKPKQAVPKRSRFSLRKKSFSVF